MSLILRHRIGEFHSGNDLVDSEAEAVLDALIDEKEEPLLAEVFRSWHKKGIEENEIYLIAKIMRGRMTTVNSRHDTFVDIVGTGGSRVKTFNVSTAAAFVVAGAGVPVAKHGNKAATSSSGSADVLAELGVEPAVDAATAERCLNEIGLCFLYAPNFHRLSPTLGKVRREFGFPTIFNCVGPLCNPAKAPYQLIGVWDKGLVPKMANALARLGTKKSWIVHGNDSLDEISLSGSTSVAEIENGSVHTFEITPEDFGVGQRNMKDLSANDPVQSAKIIRDVLENRVRDSTAEHVVLINAAAVIYVCGFSDNLQAAYETVRESIRSGNALTKLNSLAAAVRK